MCVRKEDNEETDQTIDGKRNDFLLFREPPPRCGPQSYTECTDRRHRADPATTRQEARENRNYSLRLNSTPANCDRLEPVRVLGRANNNAPETGSAEKSEDSASTSWCGRLSSLDGGTHEVIRQPGIRGEFARNVHVHDGGSALHCLLTPTWVRDCR